MLEEANGVAVAVVKVADARFLIGRSKGDGSSAGWQTPAYRQARNDRREVGLVEVQHRGFVVGCCHASLLSGHWLGEAPAMEPPKDADAGSNQKDERESEAPKSANCSGSQMGSVRV